MTKKLHIKTYGCQMNVYDSERIGDLMGTKGYELTDNVEEADVVVLNTCHIREKAKEKIYSELGRIRPLKENKKAAGSYMAIVIAGCVAQAEGEEIFRRMPMVDVVVGPESYHKMPEMVDVVFKESGRAIKLDFTPHEKFDTLPKMRQGKGVVDCVTVQEGCDKFCSYCVVPYTRGAEFSRPVKEVLEEVKILADKGVKEIMLLGQNVDAYHGVNEEGKEINLAKLIKMVAKIDGIERIRYTTSYPDEVDEELIEAHATVKELMPFIFLPVQSGSNSVLKSMNRRYTREQYLDIINKLKSARSDMAFSSDFIVGFAGETEEDFQETLDLIREVGYAQCFSFKYSPRPGTPGADMENQIPEDIKDRRLQELQALTGELQEKFNKSFLDKEVEVLIENVSEKGGDKVFGRTPHMQAAVVSLVGVSDPESARDYAGKTIKVKINKASVKGLEGVSS